MHRLNQVYEIEAARAAKRGFDWIDFAWRVGVCGALFVLFGMMMLSVWGAHNLP